MHNRNCLESTNLDGISNLVNHLRKKLLHSFDSNFLQIGSKIVLTNIERVERLPKYVR